MCLLGRGNPPVRLADPGHLEDALSGCLLKLNVFQFAATVQASPETSEPMSGVPSVVLCRVDQRLSQADELAREEIMAGGCLPVGQARTLQAPRHRVYRYRRLQRSAPPQRPLGHPASPSGLNHVRFEELVDHYSTVAAFLRSQDLR